MNAVSNVSPASFVWLAERPGDFDGSWRSGVEEEEDEWVDGRVGHNGHPDDCLHTNILKALFIPNTNIINN